MVKQFSGLLKIFTGISLCAKDYCSKFLHNKKFDGPFKKNNMVIIKHLIVFIKKKKTRELTYVELTMIFFGKNIEYRCIVFLMSFWIIGFFRAKLDFKKIILDQPHSLSRFW